MSADAINLLSDQSRAVDAERLRFGIEIGLQHKRVQFSSERIGRNILEEERAGEERFRQPERRLGNW